MRGTSEYKQSHSPTDDIEDAVCENIVMVVFRLNVLGTNDAVKIFF